MSHPGLFLVPQRSVCCPGYYGHMCEMCPGKPGQWCSGNGECQDGIEGSGECRCLEGFHGTACEMCEVGRYGADCKSGDSDGYCSLCPVCCSRGRKAAPGPLRQANSWWATKGRVVGGSAGGQPHFHPQHDWLLCCSSWCHPNHRKLGWSVPGLLGLMVR